MAVIHCPFQTLCFSLRIDLTWRKVFVQLEINVIYLRCLHRCLTCSESIPQIRCRSTERRQTRTRYAGKQIKIAFNASHEKGRLDIKMDSGGRRHPCFVSGALTKCSQCRNVPRETWLLVGTAGRARAPSARLGMNVLHPFIVVIT